MQDHGRDRSRALGEFQRSSRRLLPEQPKQSQIWSHLRPERRYTEQFPLILTSLSKGSEGSRRPPGDGLDDSTIPSRLPGHLTPRPEVADYLLRRFPTASVRAREPQAQAVHRPNYPCGRATRGSPPCCRDRTSGCSPSRSGRLQAMSRHRRKQPRRPH